MDEIGEIEMLDAGGAEDENGFEDDLPMIAARQRVLMNSLLEDKSRRSGIMPAS